MKLFFACGFLIIRKSFFVCSLLLTILFSTPLRANCAPAVLEAFGNLTDDISSKAVAVAEKLLGVMNGYLLAGASTIVLLKGMGLAPNRIETLARAAVEKELLRLNKMISVNLPSAYQELLNVRVFIAEPAVILTAGRGKIDDTGISLK